MFTISKKTIIGGAIGNALEMYDYVIWGLFSVYLSKEFLPPQAKLSDIYFLFLITYILRPIGGILGGILADQIGRKKMLTLSIVLMGFCTGLISVLPSYQEIGVISVFLLLFIRLIQVFAIGSEYISSISLLIESCDKKKRGYFGSWAAFGVNAGMLISSLVSTLLLYLIDIHILPEWGWRIAFSMAFITILIGFWIRNSIPESLEFVIKNARREKRTFCEIIEESLYVLKTQFFETTLVFFTVCFGVSATILFFVYGPIHMTTVNNLHHTQAFTINSVSLLLLTSLVPIFGFLSDTLGRTKVLLVSTIALVLLIIPYFKLLSMGTFFQILLIDCLCAIPCASVFAITPVLITEIFPMSVRCSVTNLIYSIAACLGGGVTPLIAFKLGSYNSYFPSLILIILGSACLFLLNVFLRKQNTHQSLKLVSE